MHRIRIRVTYRRPTATTIVLALVLLAVASVLMALAVRRTHAGAPSRPVLQRAAPSPRHFYVTQTMFSADEATTACASGYHFASLWEIADPSNLKYDTRLGLTSPDSGHGPPVAIPFFSAALPVRGWVRTSRLADTSSIAGQANCDAWTSASGFHRGTIVNLPSDWTGVEQDVGVWNADTSACDSPRWVWCVQDFGPWRVFLPLTLK